ncbi:hypothetical protein TH66_08630 [Carbonactinospora thermoautotrophica]|uniref:Excreted virulence factor EspC (Type VII ESX diderm) n=2 Tax=Carbonactinospora thermoautotrophica TaxID=1469144 RepID=A0A132NCU8_9ACTN|nr:hypothetical protein LI90_1248 [Carbonactinospora thermoautotrophica]KWX04009.1 hypothetical protein TH66_08630 [Carbonactinospora thermoautotrophica]KWX07796.1 hypothetical protein TR74_17545 [Carbonactinospora thermoautotrophica]
MARAAEDVAEQAREGTAKLGTPTAAAARGLAGWATGEALTGCLAAWEDHLRRLGQDVAGTADKLRANARGYQQSDEAARHSFGGG